jgi:NADPH:quinone reductase-like Zn-dependent oxidoreductase
MHAAYASSFDTDDPLSALVVGERPAPTPPPGWTTVRVVAASLNHHDLWTLRGVGITEDRLPMTLGCDAAGVDEQTGTDVVVHSVIASDGWTGDETLDTRRTLLSEKHQGTMADFVTATSFPNQPNLPSPRRPACRPPG